MLNPRIHYSRAGQTHQRRFISLNRPTNVAIINSTNRTVSIFYAHFKIVK